MDSKSSRSRRQQALRELLEQHPVSGGGKMIVAEDIKMLVPILVGICGGEIDRKQVDERLAAGRTKVSPQRDLPAVAVVLRDLLRPGVDHNGERNAAARQQVGQFG